MKDLCPKDWFIRIPFIKMGVVTDASGSTRTTGLWGSYGREASDRAGCRSAQRSLFKEKVTKRQPSMRGHALGEPCIRESVGKKVVRDLYHRDNPASNGTPCGSESTNGSRESGATSGPNEAGVQVVRLGPPWHSEGPRPAKRGSFLRRECEGRPALASGGPWTKGVDYA